MFALAHEICIYAHSHTLIKEIIPKALLGLRVVFKAGSVYKSTCLMVGTIFPVDLWMHPSPSA